MLKVYHHKDRVVLDLCSKRRDVLLTCGEAENLKHALRSAAVLAERSVDKELYRGEVWNIRVESYDGKVAIRVDPPTIGSVDRVLLPVEVAVRLADLIQFKTQQAAYKMRFTRVTGLQEKARLN